MSSSYAHRTNRAQSGPPPEPRRPPAPPPPPPWLKRLWLIGLAVSLLLWLVPFPSPSRAGTASLSYSDWRAKVDAQAVKTATIDPSGHVHGRLTSGGSYTTQIPTALSEAGLTGDL